MVKTTGSDEVVARGHFWLEDENLGVAGELKYSPDSGATVYLFGAFEDIAFQQPETPVRYPLVRGHTENLGRVCLLDALQVNQQFGTRPTATQIHSNRVLHSTSWNDFCGAPILKLKAEIDCLHEWVGITGFSITNSPDTREVQVNFRSPDPIEFEACGSIVTFTFGRTGPSRLVIQKDATVSQSTYLSITFEAPAPLGAAIERLETIKNLVALAVGRSLTWKSVEAKFAVVSTALDGAWASVLGKPIGKPCHEILHPLEMLFTFNDIRPRFESALRAWLRVEEEVKPLYTLYTATTRGEGLYSEHRLFNFFQALESYHRMRFEVDEESKRMSNVIREKILASCSLDEKEWAKDKLQHLGEPSAAERIKTLVEKLEAKWIFEPDWEETVKRIKNLRNYFTHYSKKPSSESLNLASIYNDGSRLQVLCEQILLIEIGFQPTEAAALLQKNARLQKLSVR